MYGCEAWTISEEMERRIEAALMWFYRRMLEISWTERVTNEAVLQRAGACRELMETIRQRHLRFIGHVMRTARERLRDGQCRGQKKKGKAGSQTFDTLAKSVGGGTTPVQLLQMTERRLDWCSMVDSVLGDTGPR